MLSLFKFIKATRAFFIPLQLDVFTVKNKILFPIKHMKKLLSLFFILLLIVSSLTSQESTKIVQNGKEFYKYEVKDGETLYRISKSFNIPQEEIIQFNPQAQMGVSTGMTILIPTVSTWKALNNTPKTESTTPAEAPSPKPVTKAPTETIQEVAKPQRTTLTIPSRINSSDEQVYKVHVVEKGETKYKIMKQYGIDEATLLEHNPSLANGLKTGDKVRIPTLLPKQTAASPVKQSSNNNYFEHTVQPKENWYSISRLYNVNVKELQDANPDLSYGLTIGQIVKIPKKQGGAQSQKITPAPKPTTIAKPTESAPANRSANTPVAAPVQKTETKSAPAKPISAMVTPNTNPAPTPAPKPIAAPVIKPNDMVVRVAFLLPFMINNQQKQDATLDKFIEFYEGALIGINKLKEEGVSVEINTFDVEKTDTKVKEILAKTYSLKKMDLIIGPAYSSQVNAVTEFGRDNKIPVIVPFSSKIDSIGNNPYIFQNNCPQNKQFSKAAQLFIKNFADKNIIVVNFNNDTEDEGSEFARALKTKLRKQQINFTDIQFTQENFLELPNRFTPGKETILVLATDKSALVKDLLPKISAQNSTDKPVSVFGFNKWEHTLKAYPSTYYYSSFFIARGNKENAQYRNLFHQEFGNPSTGSPRFDLMGYDLTTYFVKAVRLYGKDFAGKLSGYQSGGLQSKFSFVRNSDGGYINEGVHIIHFDNDKGSNIVE